MQSAVHVSILRNITVELDGDAGAFCLLLQNERLKLGNGEEKLKTKAKMRKAIKLKRMVGCLYGLLWGFVRSVRWCSRRQ